MMRHTLLTLAALSLSIACKTTNTAETETPATDAPTDTATPDTTPPADGTGPQVRTSSSTTGTTVNKLGKGPRVKVAALIAKKKPSTTGGKSTTPPTETKEPVVVTGFFPQTAAVGSMIEIYGSNFSPVARQHQVRVGGKRFRVQKVFEDRIVVKVEAAASGPIEIIRGKVFKGHESEIVTTTATFTSVAADKGFNQPRVEPAGGLLGTVYDIGKASTEIPAFADIGEPVGYIAVDDLDIAPGEYPGVTLAGRALTENFGVHFQGALNIPEGGSYEFCLNAGDGALLYLDQQVIVDLDGAGEARESCETLSVEPGEYAVDLLWYQNDGSLGLSLTWAKDGGAKETIPAASFFPPDVAGIAAQIEQNG